MIKTVGQLLRAFLDAERAKLDEVNLKHGPTIGAMYEGLARSALDLAIPTNAPLQVVSGFARGTDGVLSDQLDAMLIVGDAERIPFTSNVICPVDRVAAVIEVKKSLYTGQIEEGFQNLHSVHALTTPPLTPRQEESCAQAFTQIFRQPLPRDLRVPSDFQQHVTHIVANALSRPVRILLGFHGFKSEASFRKGIANYLESTTGRPGGGPNRLPDLTLNANLAMMKNTASPWTVPVTEENVYPFLITTGQHNTVGILLETLWSRLLSMRLISHRVFGVDLEMEVVNRFIDAVFMPGQGWGYRVAPEPLARPGGTDLWEWVPESISERAFSVLFTLMRSNPLKRSDAGDEPTAVDAVSELIRKHIVGVDPTDGTMHILYTNPLGMSLSDGRHVVGENVTGRMQRWFNQQRFGDHGVRVLILLTRQPVMLTGSNPPHVLRPGSPPY
jgi:hypothetical protein